MKPVVLAVDASVDVTGAFVALRREAILLEASADFALVLPRESRIPDSLLEPFAEVLKLPMPQLRKDVRSLASYLPALLAASARLRLWLWRHGCERVQINDFYLMHGALLRIFGFRGRIVTWVRIDPRRFGLLGRAWMAIARRSSDQLIAVSRFIRARLPESAGCRVLYESREPERGCRSALPSYKRLLYVGNYIPGKGQDDAIAAFERVAPYFPDARLCFVGGDMGRPANRAYRSSLMARSAKGPAAAQIDFLDRTNELARLYCDSYAALNFSSSESFSLTCQDACAFGLPVVATRSGGPEEIIEDDRSGFLVPVGDVSAMADRIRRLLAEPALAARMGGHGAEIVLKRFDPARIRDELIELLALH